MPHIAEVIDISNVCIVLIQRLQTRGRTTCYHSNVAKNPQQVTPCITMHCARRSVLALFVLLACDQHGSLKQHCMLIYDSTSSKAFAVETALYACMSSLFSSEDLVIEAALYADTSCSSDSEALTIEAALSIYKSC